MISAIKHPQAPVQRHPAVPPKFGGQAEYNQFLTRLRQFDKDGIEQLAQIKRVEAAEAPAHKEHLTLALQLGKQNPHIKWLNDQIVRLIKQRNGNKTSNPAASDVAKEHLGDLRDAQNDVLKENGFDKGGNPFAATNSDSAK